MSIYNFKIYIIFGINISNPIIAEQIAKTNTAPAEISFESLAISFFFGLAKSTTFSMAVLNNQIARIQPN